MTSMNKIRNLPKCDRCRTDPIAYECIDCNKILCRNCDIYLHNLKTKIGHIRNKIKSRDHDGISYNTRTNDYSMISTDKFLSPTRHSLYREE